MVVVLEMGMMPRPPSMKETMKRLLGASYLEHSRRKPEEWKWYWWEEGVADSREMRMAMGMAEIRRVRRTNLVEHKKPIREIQRERDFERDELSS